MQERGQNRTILCRIDELQDPGSRGMSVRHRDLLLEVFVVRRGDEVRAYLNRCPHTGSPLDWVPNEFLSLDKRHIQCATHAALFRLADGLCIAGPCAGDSLTSIPVELTSGLVVISAAGLPAGIA